MVEALVPDAQVAEERRPLQPVGDLDPLLGLGRRGLALLGRLLDLLLGRLADRPLLLDLIAQLLKLALSFPELLLEHAEPLLGGVFCARRRGHRENPEDHEGHRLDDPHHPPAPYDRAGGSG